MAVHVGSQWVPAGSTGFSVYVGFRPQLVIFFQSGIFGVSGTPADRTPTEGTELTAVGWFTDGFGNAAAAWRDDYNAATTNSQRRTQTSGWIIPNGASGATHAASGSITNTGFTISITTAMGTTGTRFGYIAADGLEGVKSGTFNTPEASTAVTGVGFAPDAVMLLTGWQAASFYDSHIAHSIGMFDADSQFGIHLRSTDNAAAADTYGGHRVTGALWRSTTAGVDEATVGRASLDADGFTLSGTNPAGLALAPAYYLALAGDVRVDVAAWGVQDLPGQRAGFILGGGQAGVSVDATATNRRGQFGVWGPQGQASVITYMPKNSDPTGIKTSHSDQDVILGQGSYSATTANYVTVVQHETGKLGGDYGGAFGALSFPTIEPGWTDLGSLSAMKMG